jgi:protein-disulfide isomerase
VAAIVLAFLSAAPAASGSDLEEIRETQKKILERLDRQDRMLQDILQRLTGQPQPPGPNEIYDLPVAHSPIRGPKDARVTLVEFGDFQ